MDGLTRAAATEDGGPVVDAQRIARIDLSAGPAARMRADRVAVLLRGSSMRFLEMGLAALAIATALAIGLGR
jgi:hypothetical protein